MNKDMVEIMRLQQELLKGEVYNLIDPDVRRQSDKIDSLIDRLQHGVPVEPKKQEKFYY